MTRQGRMVDEGGPGEVRTATLSSDQLSELLMRRRQVRGPGVAGAVGGEIRSRPSGEPTPASFAQQRLWLLDRLQPGSAAYNMPFSYRIEGPLDRGALERAFADLVDRHEVPADGLHRARRPPVPARARRPGGWLRLHSPRPRGPGARRALPRGGAAAGPGGRASVRPRRRPSAPRAPRPAVGGRARPGDQRPPHRLRRLVAGDPVAGADRALRRPAAEGQRPRPTGRRRRSVRSSTATSPAGSGSGSREGGSSATWSTGANAWPVTCRCSTCPPIGPGRASRSTAAAWWRRSCRRTWPMACGAWPGTGKPRCSWSCSPRMRCWSAAWPARRTCWWGRRPRGAAAPSSKG